MKNSDEAKKERRRSQRLDVNEGITGRIKPTMEVRIINVSQHGILIESPCGLPPAGMCELTVESPSGPKVIRGRVARCRAQMVKQDDGKVAIRFHAGLEFPEDLQGTLEIQNLISEICTLEAPAEQKTEKVRTATLEQAM
jgi:hypothetical protein